MRRIVAVLIFTVALAVPSSVFAECAWVLWEIAGGPKVASTEPIRGYATKPDCDRALSDTLAAFTSTPAATVVHKDLKLQEVFVNIGGAVTGYRYMCLPDTLDPRGPKGK